MINWAMMDMLDNIAKSASLDQVRCISMKLQ